MKIIIAFLFASSVALGQDFAASTGYHMTAEQAMLGISGSMNLKTWNDRKVIVRAVSSYYSGSTWNTSANLKANERFEFGFESKNTMITGEKLFNIIGVGYQISQFRTQAGASTEQGTRSGLFVSVGIGTWLVKPISAMLRYVSGYDNGVRLGLDVDF